MAAKFVVASLVASAAVAEPIYGGYGGYAGYGYGSGVAGHHGGGSSFVGRTVWGFPSRHGKRSADAEPEAEAEAYYGYGGYGGGYGGYAGYGYGRGVASHYGGGRSFTYRGPQGLGKRSADAEPEAEAEAYYGYGAGYGSGYGGYAGYGYGRGVASHYGGGSSYVYRSPQGLRGKRSAEPFGLYNRGYGYGGSYQSVVRPYANSAYSVRTNGYGASVQEDNYNGAAGYFRGKRSAEPFGYGYGRSYQSVVRPYANSAYSVSTGYGGARVQEDNYNGASYGYGYGRFGRGKRSAEPFGYGYGAGSYQTVSRPGSTYSVRDNQYSANVVERNSNYGAAYGYGFNSGRYGYGY